MIMSDTIEKTKKTASFLEVILIEPDSERISESLGMTDERYDEIQTLVDEVMHSEEIQKHTVAMHAISLKVKHANELALAMFFYGTKVGQHRVLERIASEGPAAILGGLFSHKKSSGKKSDESSDEENTGKEGN